MVDHFVTRGGDKIPYRKDRFDSKGRCGKCVHFEPNKLDWTARATKRHEDTGRCKKHDLTVYRLGKPLANNCFRKPE